MSLVLNGGITGALTTGGGYVDWDIAGTLSLPITMSAWFQSGNNVGPGATRTVIGITDKDDATVIGNYLIQARVTRNTGPLLTVSSAVQQTILRTKQPSPVTAYAIDNITAGAQTVITLASAPAHPFVAGDWITMSAIATPFSSLDDNYEIESVSGDDITINVDTSAITDPYVAAADTMEYSQWNPGARWNLLVVTISATTPTRDSYTSREGDTAFVRVSDETETGASADSSGAFSVADRLVIGRVTKDALAGNALNGKIAHAALWSGKRATGTEAVELLTNTPNNVSWGTPAGYWPLVSDGADAIATNDLTLVGSYSFDSDEPTLTGSTPGGGGGSLPIFQYYYQGNKG